jgi:hypothetical protein
MSPRGRYAPLVDMTGRSKEKGREQAVPSSLSMEARHVERSEAKSRHLIFLVFSRGDIPLVCRFYVTQGFAGDSCNAISFD